MVKWPRSLKDTYLFGTRMSFIENGNIKFENDKMPPTMDIHFWKSDVGLFEDGFLGGLPLLKKNHEYKMIFSGTVIPEHSVYFELIFFDAQDNTVGKKIISENEGTFIYPKSAFKYEIHLKNINNIKCNFTGLILEEKDFLVRHSIYLSDNGCFYAINNSVDFHKQLKVNIQLSHRMGDVFNIANKFDDFDIVCLIFNNNTTQKHKIDSLLIEIYKKIVNIFGLLSLDIGNCRIDIDDCGGNTKVNFSKIIGSLIELEHRNTVVVDGKLINLSHEENQCLNLISRKINEV